MQKQHGRQLALAGIGRGIDPRLQPQAARAKVEALYSFRRIDPVPLLRRGSLAHQFGLELRTGRGVILALQIRLGKLLLKSLLHLDRGVPHGAHSQKDQASARQRADQHNAADNPKHHPQSPVRGVGLLTEVAIVAHGFTSPSE